MIDGVKIKPLRQIKDERGKVMHMVRSDDPEFVQFGEVYFSCIYPDAIKAWKLHKEMTLNVAVPFGQMKFVLYDVRKDSPTFGKIQEIVLGQDNYCLVTVPPMIWTGSKGMGNEMAILANCATHPHTHNEFERCDFSDSLIPYNWSQGSV